jgi:5-methylcytosine-specific restriction protein A
MPKKRQPKEIWQLTRLKVLERDTFSCVRCKAKVTVTTAHIDHIISGIRGSNHMENLRTLCRQCHVLRADSRHRGMIAKALKDGIISPGVWREQVWTD